LLLLVVGVPQPQLHGVDLLVVLLVELVDLRLLLVVEAEPGRQRVERVLPLLLRFALVVGEEPPEDDRQRQQRDHRHGATVPHHERPSRIGRGPAGRTFPPAPQPTSHVGRGSQVVKEISRNRGAARGRPKRICHLFRHRIP
jgi:hypothetical protein